MSITVSLLISEVSQHVADSLSALLNNAGSCSSCAYHCSDHSSLGIINTIVLALLVLIGGFLLYKSQGKRYIFFIAVLVSGLVVASYFVSPYIFDVGSSCSKNCTVLQADDANTSVFLPPTDEFQDQDTAEDGEFLNAQGVPDSLAGEFVAISSDEFSEESSASASQNEFTQIGNNDDGAVHKSLINRTRVVEPIAIFLIIFIISLLIKHEWFRKTRPFFLVASLIYLGFVRGACPCMISSFEETVFKIMGVSVSWENLLWFVLLIPSAYLFGKIWCGWLCHLGALQEIIHRTSKFNFFSTRKAQKTIYIIQISVFIIWILQLLITKTNLFCKYDPFRVAFNLFSVNWIGWVLLSILLISSLLMHRPFCRTICPVGLILGWVSLLPKAKKLCKDEECINCRLCSRECACRALINEDKKTTLTNRICIMCGECMSSCKTTNCLKVKRGNKKAVISMIIVFFFASQPAFAQWDCPSRIGARLKPIGNSNVLWASEFITSGGMIGANRIANAMAFAGVDYTFKNRNTFYFEGGVKYWISSDGSNVIAHTPPKFGLREAFYRYSDDNNKLTVGLQSARSDDYYLLNERLLGVNYKRTINNLGLSIIAGSVLQQTARNGIFCTEGYLYNVSAGRQRAFIGKKIGETNVAMATLTYTPRSNSEASEFEQADTHQVSIEEVGGVLYCQYAPNITNYNHFIGGAYSTVDIFSYKVKLEMLYQAASENNALLYNMEVNKDYLWNDKHRTKVFAKHYGVYGISSNAMALNSFSNVFAGEVLRLDAMELPFFQMGIKHSFLPIRASLKLQAAMQVKPPKGYMPDSFGTVPSKMKEIDLSFTKNFGKYFLINAFLGYLENPSLIVDEEGSLRYKNISSLWGKVELRFTF